MAYPTALSNYTGSETLSAAGHATNHNALEAKLGIGSSTATANTVLRGTASGTSSWGQVDLTADITGTLPVANGGTGGTTSTGTGAVVLDTSPTIASPTLTTPTLGVATATSVNKVTITAPTTSATLTLVTGSSLITSGAYAITLTSTATTGVTLPTTGTLSTLAGAETFTNKRVTKRAPTVTQSATPTINTDVTDVAHITGLAQAITSFTTNLSGTPVQGDTLRIDITDDGTARAITWGASFEASGTVALPTTTVLSVRLDVGFIWNTVTSKWRCVAVA